jgi:GPH family glycoside/pentoside/hexuronide:cation symporter
VKALGQLERWGFAVGDSASNLYWKTFEFFLVLYYTDVFGLAPSQVAMLLLVTRLSDAILDPLMGALADRTTTRFGKFRPYVLLGAPALALSAVLAFTRPDFGSSGNLVYAYVTHSVLMLAYTVVNIPYSALLGVMTDDPVERTRLSSYRFAGAFIAGVFVQKFTLDLVQYWGKGDAALGWQRTMMAYGLLSMTLLAITFFTTRERLSPQLDVESSSREDLKAILHNRPWLTLFGLGLLVIVAFWIRGGASAYYFKYFVRDTASLGTFLASGGVAALVGSLCTARLTLLLGKRRAYAFCMASAALTMAAFRFCSPGDIRSIYALNGASAFLLGPTAPLVWSMYADTADHVEWQSGRRATGLVFAAATFGTKLGGALGGWCTGMLLTWFGYVAGAEQSQATLSGIVLMMSLVPAVVCAAAAGLVMGYPLDEAELARISDELRNRRLVRIGGEVATN